MSTNNSVQLEWNDFQVNATKWSQYARQNQDYCDVTLALDNTQPVQAHRLILSSGSRFFRTVLKQAEGHQHPFIYLKGVASSDLNWILDFIYSGETKVPHDKLANFLEVAKDLGVLGLQDDKQGNDYKAKLEETDNDLAELVFVHDGQETQNGDILENPELVAEYTKEEFETNLIAMETKHDILLDGKFALSTNINADERPSYVEQNAGYFRDILERMCDMNEEGWSCTECNTSFKTKDHIMEHVENHVKGLQYPCNLCGKVFITSKNIQSHITNTHKGNKTVKREPSEYVSFLYLDSFSPQCKLCSYTLKKREGRRIISHFLNRHKGTTEEGKLRVMTEEKTYKELFGQIELLNSESFDTLFTDMVQITTGNQWQCNVCGHINEDRSYMKQHADTHLKSEDPSSDIFTCYECEERFNSREELGVHWTLQHSTDPQTSLEVKKRVLEMTR